MKLRRRLLTGATIVAALLLVLNVLSAFIATRPRLQAKVFGVPNSDSPAPDVPYDTIRYGKNLAGWWIEAEHSRAVVVMVHGFNLAAEPLRHDPSRMVDLSADFRAAGYSTLLINLGYASGAHIYTGGRAEARDIDAAVAWAKRRGAGPVVLWGFSAGAHDVLIAGRDNPDVIAVASDSAFVDTAAVVRLQAARTVHLPEAILGLTPLLFHAFGARETNVTGHWRKPVLIIHGTADTAISPTNAERLHEITGGQLWMVRSAEHARSYEHDRDGYRKRAIEFIASAIRGIRNA